MSRDHSLYLEDILEACDKIISYTEDISQREFNENTMRFDAVVRNLEIIGEASRQLPESITTAISEVPWREIIGMRNILIHSYFGIDPDVVWSVVTTKIEPLKIAIERHLAIKKV